MRIACVVNYRKDLARGPIDNRYRHLDRYYLDNVQHTHVNTLHLPNEIFFWMKFLWKNKIEFIKRFVANLCLFGVNKCDFYLWQPRQSQTYNQFTSMSSSVFTGNGSVLMGVCIGCWMIGLVGVAFNCGWVGTGAGGNDGGVCWCIIGCGIGFEITC